MGYIFIINYVYSFLGKIAELFSLPRFNWIMSHFISELLDFSAFLHMWIMETPLSDLRFEANFFYILCFYFYFLNIFLWNIVRFCCCFNVDQIITYHKYGRVAYLFIYLYLYMYIFIPVSICMYVYACAYGGRKSVSGFFLGLSIP